MFLEKKHLLLGEKIMSDLVFKKTILKTDFTLLNKLIYGLPKTSKSTLCSKMKDGVKEPLFIATEDGYGALEVFAQRVENWAQFIKVRDYIIANKEEVKKQHSCLVIDLVSDLDIMAERFICETYKIKALADLEWGKGFSLQANEFQQGILPLMNVLPMTFITHAQEKELMYNGEKIRLQAPTMSKKSLDFINGKVDMIGFIIPANTKNDKPVLTFRPSTMAIAGSRFSHMCREFPLSFNDMDGSYQAINNYFQTKQ